MKDSLEFYNQFDEKLIKDYANGNKRIVSAIQSLAEYIPSGEKINVLDIGCGLGWSTYEFSRFFKNAFFDGVDLSPVLIESANRLFQNDNLNFNVFDITKEVPNKRYDAIVMIDVYEHIPKKERKEFHQSLFSLLNPGGRILLGCPSIYHQKYLKENNPQGLQPVDEDIDLDLLQQTAKDVEGQIIYFEFKHIWRSFDYLHGVIQNNVGYNLSNSLRRKNTFQVENQNARINRIKDKLNMTFELKNSDSKLLKGARKLKRKIFN